MDVSTTVTMLSLVNLMLAVALLAQSKYTKRYPGMHLWAAGQMLIATGLTLSVFRGPSLIGKIMVPVWQTTTIAGFALVYLGILRFFGQRERRLPLAALLIGLAAWSSFFTFVIFLVPPRSSAILACAAALMIACARAVHRFAEPAVRTSAHFLRIVFGVLGGAYLILAAIEATRWDYPEGMLTPNPVFTAAYVVTTCGTVLWVVGLIFMLNERLQSSVATQADTMTRVFSTSPDCAIVTRLADGHIVNVNEGFTRITGYSRDEAVGRSSLDLGLWRSASERDDLLEALALTGACENLPVVLRRKDGSTFECLMSASTLTLEGTPHIISLTRDVTEQRALEAKLTHDASTDALTGVPNRREFLARAHLEVTAASMSHRRLCVAVIDIDSFKQINDVCGHAAGDAALTHFARVAQGRTREIDTLGRLGGDEFGLLLPSVDLDEAHRIVDRIRQDLLNEPVPDVDTAESLILTMSAGVAAFGESAETLQDAIALADSALYRAKAEGRNRTVMAR